MSTESPRAEAAVQSADELQDGERLTVTLPPFSVVASRTKSSAVGHGGVKYSFDELFFRYADQPSGASPSSHVGMWFRDAIDRGYVTRTNDPEDKP